MQNEVLQRVKKERATQPTIKERKLSELVPPCV
jgi:hypothetical protein